jgi:hypothetical protein
MKSKFNKPDTVYPHGLKKIKIMIKFNPENKSDLTYGETLGPAMEIKDQAEADQYFKDYLEWEVKQLGGDVEKAMEICKSNLGYYAGYYSNETRERVEKLFLCSHPIFGSIKANGVPTAKEAFEMGVAMSKKSKP